MINMPRTSGVTDQRVTSGRSFEINGTCVLCKDVDHNKCVCCSGAIATIIISYVTRHGALDGT